MVAALGFLAAACSDDINLGQVNPDNAVVPDGDIIYITDAAGKRHFSNVEFRGNSTEKLTLNTPHELANDCSVSFAYDESVLTEYNEKNMSSYVALPADMVSFAGNGVATLSAGSTSTSVEYTITSDGSLDPSATYVLPVRVSVTDGNASLGSVDATRIIFVRDLTALPDATKYVRDADGNLVPGIKVFSCMEVNDTNPLNNLSFTLKNAEIADNNGKPLVDALIIFSANINYNPETGRVYIFNDENVQALLDNREHYLKPLQDRGMKIILGILGNHDRSGIANLADDTAVEFAKECKAVCDAYNLDGIFVDDEYSSYQTPPPPGFVSPSKAAASRLMYEIKKAMPDRLMVAYCYSRTYGADNVKDLETGETVKAGDFVDYALHDYGGSADLASSFDGMQRWQMGLYSQEFNQGRMASLSNLKRMRENGYGAHMIFAMDPNRNNFYSQQSAMQNCAEAFYDADLEFDGKKYPKDWK